MPPNSHYRANDAVVRKPKNFQWIGFSEEQVQLLDLLDFVGNNGWARNSQSETLMPRLLGDLAAAGASMARIKEAMKSIGYSKDALHQVDRWESKRRTGRLGR